MVPAERFELPTFGLQNRCTTAVLRRLPRTSVRRQYECRAARPATRHATLLSILLVASPAGAVHRPAAERRLSGPQDRAVLVPPLARRLIGDRCVLGAIGEMGVGRAAAEVEILVFGITDRPFAHAIGQAEDRGA